MPNSANRQPPRWWCLVWPNVVHVLVLMVLVVIVVSLMRWGYDAGEAIGLVATAGEVFGLVAMMAAVSLTIVHWMLSRCRQLPA